MLRLVADENLNNNLIRGLRRRNPRLDIVRLYDVGLLGASDPEVLEWCAREHRVLLTHDFKTIPGHLAERQRNGLATPGIFLIRQINNNAWGQIIEDLLLAAECYETCERVEFCLTFPLP